MGENRFDPEDSIRAIHACAPVYLERLLGRHVLFVPGDGSAPMETLYGADNFMHLCGVHYEDVSPKDFWEMALRSRLTPDGLLPNNKGVTAKRLVLSTLVRIDTKATMMIESPVLPGRTRADAICANLPYAVGYARRSSELFHDGFGVLFAVVPAQVDDRVHVHENACHDRLLPYVRRFLTSNVRQSWHKAHGHRNWIPEKCG